MVRKNVRFTESYHRKTLCVTENALNIKTLLVQISKDFFFFYRSELASPSTNKVTCPSYIYLSFGLCTRQSWHLSSFLVTFFVVQHQKPWNFSWIVSISLKEVCPILSCLVFVSGFFATSNFSAWLSRLMVHLTILVFNLHLVLRSGGLLVQQVLFTWLARSSF